MNEIQNKLSRRGFVLSCLAGGAAFSGCGGGEPLDGELASQTNEIAGATEHAMATPTVAQKLTDYWNTLFVNGGMMVTSPDGTEAYVTYNGHVLSEGMSYCMMICVMMNDKTRFMRFWKWVKNHMRHSSGIRAGRLAWKCSTGWSGFLAVEEQSAPDGEIWMATALHLAADRGWGAALRTDANAMCNTMLATNVDSALLPYFNPTNNIVNFVPETWSNYTDPSYATPAFFTYLAGKTGNNRWNTIATAHRNLMIAACNENNQGLAPDFSGFDGKAVRTMAHASDAWRVSMNQTLDNLWNGNTSHVAKAKSAVAFMSQGLNPGHLQSVCPVYAPSYQGGPYTDVGQIAMYATVTKGGANTAAAQLFVTALLNAPVQTTYYQGLLCTLSLLILNNKFVKTFV